MQGGAHSWRARALDMGTSVVAIPADLALAALVVGVVVTMVVPVPAVALDFLIALNLAGSLGMLLVALSVRDASRLAALPSLLLIATIFRLGLNVSTTRLVLLDGDAGQIVEAFGRVVVGGNVVVGFCVFLVLALVQFVVIAKGAERVAEVAARFTLDALPGKQMSIDADLRAGATSLDEAQARRRAVERESQLYGALDGAMKFVKGDAVAGLVIVAINLVGGFAVGVVQRGMELGAAAAHYTVLTVGDGLVTQIPSLLVSTTAGIVVTRVPSERDGGLGGDITAELGAQPRALLVTSALLLALAFAPGLPAVPFLALGLGLGLVGVRRLGLDGGAGEPRPAASNDDQSLVLRSGVPIRVELDAALYDARRADLAAGVPGVRSRLYATLGVRYPKLEIVRADRLTGGAFEIALDGVVAARGAVDADAAPLLEAIERALRANATAYVGVQECRDLVDLLEATHPALVAEVVPRLLSLAQVADVLRRLVAEGVPIRDLRSVFEALATGAQHERDTAALAELARAGLRRQITADVAQGRPSLPVYALAPAVEEAFRDGLRYSQAGGPVALDPAVASRLLEQLRALDGAEREPSAVRPVLVVAPDVRRHVRAVVEVELPDLAVVSYRDLVPSLALRTIGVVG